MWLFDSHNSRLQRRIALGAADMEKEKLRTAKFIKNRRSASKGSGGSLSVLNVKKASERRESSEGGNEADTDVEDKPFASDADEGDRRAGSGSVADDSADEREKDLDDELDEMDADEELAVLMQGGTEDSYGWVKQATGGSPGGASAAARSSYRKDIGMQSMYGSTADACVATVNTTADLAKLIPTPDDAVMLRATLGSLQRLEKHASELLAHVQREISVQVEDAGVSYARQEENKNRRLGHLGSSSIHEYRSTAMSRAAQEAASREADFQMHSAGISGGAGGGGDTSAGVDAHLTKFHYGDGGKLTIKPGTAFSDRRQIQYGGSRGDEHSAQNRTPYYPPSAMHHSQTGTVHVGLTRTPFSGSTGYSLYDAKTKSKLNMLMNLGADLSHRHALYDEINNSVEYFSPLRHTIGEMARRDAEAADRALQEAQNAATSGYSNMRNIRSSGATGGAAPLPRW